jgi:hypothetical protein
MPAKIGQIDPVLIAFEMAALSTATASPFRYWARVFLASDFISASMFMEAD